MEHFDRHLLALLIVGAEQRGVAAARDCGDRGIPRAQQFAHAADKIASQIYSSLRPRDNRRPVTQKRKGGCNQPPCLPLRVAATYRLIAILEKGRLSKI